MQRGAQNRRAPCGQGEVTPELVRTRVHACGSLRVTARLPGCGAGGVAFVRSSLFTRSCPDACETLPGGQWNTGRFSPIFPASGLGQLLGDARSEARTDRNHGSGLGARRGPPSPPRPAPSALGPQLHWPLSESTPPVLPPTTVTHHVTLPSKPWTGTVPPWSSAKLGVTRRGMPERDKGSLCGSWGAPVLRCGLKEVRGCSTRGIGRGPMQRELGTLAGSGRTQSGRPVPCAGGRDTESRCDTAHLCLTGQGGSGNPSQRPAQD